MFDGVSTGKLSMALINAQYAISDTFTITKPYSRNVYSVRSKILSVISPLIMLAAINCSSNRKNTDDVGAFIRHCNEFNIIFSMFSNSLGVYIPFDSDETNVGSIALGSCSFTAIYKRS
jgi:hypothetical protein